MGEKGERLGELADGLAETIHLHLLMQIYTTQIGDFLVSRVKLLDQVLVLMAEVLELCGEVVMKLLLLGLGWWKECVW